MRRLTISVDETLADTFDRLVAEKGYENRSEAFRDLLRDELDKKRLQIGDAKYCVGVLSYVYKHHERDLPRRLTIMQHGHHDVTVATLHADHDNCIESVILRGPTTAVVAFAQARHRREGSCPYRGKKAVLADLSSRLLKLVGSSCHMYLVDLAFCLGFNSTTEIWTPEHFRVGARGGPLNAGGHLKRISSSSRSLGLACRFETLGCTRRASVAMRPEVALVGH
jgi:CopG family transcriptional regulator, nickel-responsive regulator